MVQPQTTLAEIVNQTIRIQLVFFPFYRKCDFLFRIGKHDGGVQDVIGGV